jgi:hypothetical protein
VKHYRINKVAAPGGQPLKTEDDEDCPVCEVYRAGEKVGAVLDTGDPGGK